jgi:hypothetical protein
MKSLSHRFDDLEQRRMKGPLAPASLLIKPHAKQLLRAIVVCSQHRHHRSARPEDHLVSRFWFLSAHKHFSRCLNRPFEAGSLSERTAVLYALAVALAVIPVNSTRGVSASQQIEAAVADHTQAGREHTLYHQRSTRIPARGAMESNRHNRKAVPQSTLH